MIEFREASDGHLHTLPDGYEYRGKEAWCHLCHPKDAPAPPRYVTDKQAEEIRRAWPVGEPRESLGNRTAIAFDRLLATREALAGFLERIDAATSGHTWSKDLEALLAAVRRPE
jgi:hypothetical protein